MQDREKEMERLARSLGVSRRDAERVARSVWVARMWESIDTEQGLDRVKRRLAAYRRRRRMLRVAGAVSSAAVVVLGVWFFAVWSGRNTVPDAGQRILAADSSTENITLIAEDGQRYTLNDTNDCISFDDNDLKIVKQGGVVKVLPSDEITKTGEKEIPPRMTITIPRGYERQLVLPDGTKVWLSAETTLSFPLYFPSGERSVEMEGEAYFEVTHDPTRPFSVRSGEMTLRVLGTVFNIYAYPGDQTIETTLLEGSVSQRFDGVEGEIILHPSEQTCYTRHNRQIAHTRVDPNDYKAYREGKIVFRDASAEKILLALERTYDVRIVIEKAWLKYDKYTLTVNKNEDIDIPLNKLTETGGFAYEKVDGVIRIY